MVLFVCKHTIWVAKKRAIPKNSSRHQELIYTFFRSLKTIGFPFWTFARVYFFPPSDQHHILWDLTHIPLEDTPDPSPTVSVSEFLSFVGVKGEVWGIFTGSHVVAKSLTYESGIKSTPWVFLATGCEAQSTARSESQVAERPWERSQDSSRELRMRIPWVWPPPSNSGK